ncbi:YppG family protein [Calidifontibacillus oryziterrae]|uniref:YppG family protein n=1 Tax=Calidifontibacillus oryziterrae TaxID=1191699 RepID=UPI0002D2B9B0|nr:YppG family protein [Calidifontibacillus oryziterrae]
MSYPYYRQNPFGWSPYSDPMFNYSQPFITDTGGNYLNHLMYFGISPSKNQYTALFGKHENNAMSQFPIPPPFPLWGYNYKPAQPPLNSFLSYFYDKNGNFDFNKMLTTVGQVSNTVKQVSPLLKQFGSLLGKV